MWERDLAEPGYNEDTAFFSGTIGDRISAADCALVVTAGGTEPYHSVVRHGDDYRNLLQFKVLEHMIRQQMAHIRTIAISMICWFSRACAGVGQHL